MALYKRCACADPNRCQHKWWYRFMLDGVNHRGPTGEVSKRLASQVETDAKQDTTPVPKHVMTFGDFATTYIKDHSRLHKKDKGERDQQIVDGLDASLKGKRLKDISHYDLVQWQSNRLVSRVKPVLGQRVPARSVSIATVNRELDLIKSIFSKAVEWGVLKASPATRVRRLRVANGATRILSPDEVDRLLAACKGRFKALVAFALVTGARKGELLNLEWKSVTKTEVIFWNTKSGKTRRIPITKDLTDILATLPRIHLYVFANPETGEPYTTVAKNFGRALARADITTGDVTFHTLRHTALSRMIAAGHNDHVVRRISGHSTTRMLERYTHPVSAELAAALSDVGFSTKLAQTGGTTGE